jgi:hypothetical protein
MDHSIYRRPIFDVLKSVNHTAPSGPIVMSRGEAEGVGNSVKFCAAAGVAIPTAIPNQSTIDKNERSIFIVSSQKGRWRYGFLKQCMPGRLIHATPAK